MNYKTCGACQEEKPLSEFYKSRSTKDGVAWKCKVCEKAYVNNWNKVNKQRIKKRKREYSVMFKYGLFPEDYNRMLREQQHKCLICGLDETECPYGSLSVDHNHATNKVRGLLCHNCNTSIGKFKDNPALLRAAAQYLEEKGYAVY